MDTSRKRTRVIRHKDTRVRQASAHPAIARGEIGGTRACRRWCCRGGCRTNGSGAKRAYAIRPYICVFACRPVEWGESVRFVNSCRGVSHTPVQNQQRHASHPPVQNQQRHAWHPPVQNQRRHALHPPVWPAAHGNSTHHAIRRFRQAHMSDSNAHWRTIGECAPVWLRVISRGGRGRGTRTGRCRGRRRTMTNR